MHNKDFENKVQQKMQELRFGPSDEVWMRVEAGIEKKKRKRRFAFWMLLPLIVGGAAIFMVNSQMKQGVKGVKEVKEIKEVIQKEYVAKEKNIEEGKQLANYSAVSAVKFHGIKGVKEVKELKEEAEEKRIEGKNEVANDSAVSAVKLEPTKIEEQQIEKVTTKKLKSSKWHYGIEASAGLSSFSKGLLQSHAMTAGYYYDPLAYNNTPTSVVYTPSDAKQGFAFSAGIFASRSISKKLDIRVGLSYMHASTSMKVGQKVDSARAINQSSMSMDKVDGYYSVGTSNHYTNKYDMVGLSASIDWHIARRVSWQNGINFARLVNSNALHFDGLTGSYYEDNRLFNKNQVLASSSIHFNVFKKISVGPEARFALTGMLKNNVDDKKHMRFIGIKSVLTLK